MVLVSGYSEQAEQQAVDHAKILEIVSKDFVELRFALKPRDQDGTD
jgi:hypothetical protein